MEPKLKRDYKYYQILGLDKNATIENIKQAYRLIIRKYHPDINKDSSTIEIAKKINEAYSVLSDPGKRLDYDNSEAECPTCWTHEVRRSQGKDWTSFAWRCTHCGCNFTFTAEKKGKADGEIATESEQYVCPRCNQLLILDDSLGLYRCKNKSCKGVFSRYELRKYYSKSVRRKQSSAKSGVKQNIQSQPKTTNEQSREKKIQPVVLSAIEKLVLKCAVGISTLATLVLTYYLIFSFSLLVLGLFIALLGFSMLLWYIYKYPRTISIIKSLITLK